MKKSLEQQQKELDDKWKAFQTEKTQFEDIHGVMKSSQENM